MNNLKNVFKIPLLVFLSVLYFDNRGSKFMRPILMIYSLSILTYTIHLSSIHNRNGNLFKEMWITIGLCTICIEILNQISYMISRKNYLLASKIKCMFFWLIFTFGSCMYITMLLNQSQESGSIAENKIPILALILFLGWTLPSYSLCPKIRFLILHG